MSQSACTKDVPLLVMEISELALLWRVITSAFLTVKEIPAEGTVRPLTLAVPETICPSITFEASVDLMVHFKEMAEPNGLGMLWATLGLKSKENKAPWAMVRKTKESARALNMLI